MQEKTRQHVLSLKRAHPEQEFPPSCSIQDAAPAPELDTQAVARAKHRGLRLTSFTSAKCTQHRLVF